MDTSNNIKIANNMVNLAPAQNQQKHFVNLDSQKDKVSFGNNTQTTEKKPKTVLVGVLSAVAGAGACFIVARKKIGTLRKEVGSLIKEKAEILREKAFVESTKNEIIHRETIKSQRLAHDKEQIRRSYEEIVGAHSRENAALKSEKAKLETVIDNHIAENTALREGKEVLTAENTILKAKLANYKLFPKVQDLFKQEHGIDLNHRELEQLNRVLSKDGSPGISMLIDTKEPLKGRVNMLTYTGTDGMTPSEVSFSLYQKAFKMINDNHAQRSKNDTPWTKAIAQAADGMDRMMTCSDPSITDGMRQETKVMLKSLVSKLKENGFSISDHYKQNYL